MIEPRSNCGYAYAGSEETIYNLNIYSRYTDFGLEGLYAILTDSLLFVEDVEISRRITEREVGGWPSAVQQWMFRHDVGRVVIEGQR